MTARLEVSRLGWRYPGQHGQALREVDLSLPAGSWTAVLGAAGAGCSTLLQCLNGAVPQLVEGGELTGRVLLDEADLADYRMATIAEFVGLVGQDQAGIVLGRTVEEDTAFGPRNLCLAPDQVHARVAGALARVGLGGLSGRAARTLSGGELQRLAIAGVLALEPQVLCLDDAGAAVDPAGRAEIAAQLAALRAEGMSLVSVESRAEEALAADQVLVLAEGSPAWRGRPADLLGDPVTMDALGLRPTPVAELMVLLDDALAAVLPDWDRHRVPFTPASAAALLGPLVGSLPARVPSTVRPAAEVIGCDRLVHHYPGGVVGLDGVSLSVRAGDFLALVGPNGAGKSTLARHLNAILAPTSGTVRLNGVPLAGVRPAELADRVGFVFQDPELQLCCRTVREEVGLGLAARSSGVGRRSRRSDPDPRIEQTLELVGLADLADQHPLSLSRGRRQLLALACALVHEPEVLVLDEPTSALDRQQSELVFGVLRQLHAGGRTIVWLCHDLDAVAELADRVISLSAGRVAGQGSPEEVFASSPPQTTPAIAQLSRLLGMRTAVHCRVADLAAALRPLIGADR